MTEVVEDAPIVKFVNILISQAVQDRASDIHIEPAERDLRVRFRIDGVLHEVMRSPRSMTAGITSRLKIMADINIAERRIPQDGRLSTTVNGKKVDLRVATLPTVWGEKIVMRILDNSTAMMQLSDLGFGAANYDIYAESFAKPYGMILVTGPTGSGKSTTLYATLTNDAPSAIVRLTEMGIEPFLVGSALDCVLAQRLARKLCAKCKEEYVPTREALADMRMPLPADEPVPTLYRPVGCSTCAKTGYRGRIALHEVMAVSEDIERLTVERASTMTIARTAREQGMITLREDGLAKVKAGHTSMEEILRVVV
jgi:type II secretory ATPase GspE/PulE/Tfp pilus assembly ATPase PilB-like protein